MSRRSKTPTPELNQKIFFYLQKVQGLGKTNIHHDMRQHISAIAEKTIKRIYEYENSSESPQPRQKLRIKPLEKFIPLPPDYKTGKLKPIKPIKSADDTNLIFHSRNGKLVIPNDVYSKACDGYCSQDKVINALGLKETHEINNVMKRLADRLYPKPKFTIKKKVQLKVQSETVKNRLYSTLKPMCMTPNRFSNLQKFDSLFETDSLSQSVMSSKELLGSSMDRLKRSTLKISGL